jgi:acetoin utilization protein AcuB
MKSKKVAIQDVMTRSPHTVGVDIPLVKAKEMFREHGIRHLPVLQRGKLVGMLSDRNVKEALNSPGFETFLVEDAMIPGVFAVQRDTSLIDVLDAMAEEKYGSTVVLDEEDKVIGVFTTVDACRVLSQHLTDNL